MYTHSTLNSVSNIISPETIGSMTGGTCPIFSLKFGLLQKTVGNTRKLKKRLAQIFIKLEMTKKILNISFLQGKKYFVAGGNQYQRTLL